MRTLMQRYLFEAIEFAAYCVVLTVLALVVVWLWVYAPSRNPAAWIWLCVVVGLLCGVRAVLLFRGFLRTRARERLHAHRRAPGAARPPGTVTADRRPWRERFDAEPSGDADSSVARLRRAVAEEDDAAAVFRRAAAAEATARDVARIFARPATPPPRDPE